MKTCERVIKYVSIIIIIIIIIIINLQFKGLKNVAVDSYTCIFVLKTLYIEIVTVFF